MVRVTFYGAAETVTGSKYLVEGAGRRLLVDCGIFQGPKELRLRNWEAPEFDASSIDAVLLTHAHIDHTGYLPLLVKYGFHGPIFCTPATDELVQMLLLDSARLQEEDAAYAKKEGTSKHEDPKPLYGEAEARAVFPLLRVIPRDQEAEIFPGVRLTPICAGHILGSASLTILLGERRLVFSGDIGRYDTPILPDPKPVEMGDLLVCESTYGDRDHPQNDILGEIEREVKGVVERGGPLIVPAFALGRTQSLLYYLAQLERANRIPALPVYVDSPMAVDVTRFYKTYDYDHDAETAALEEARISPLQTKKTVFCRTTQESKQLNSLKGPRIIISASGMATGGRILHHLRQWLPKENATVLFVGYQGAETRGAKIQRGDAEVKIFGEYVPVRALVHTISGLSAHADRGELVRWLKSSSGTPRVMKISHGEKEASESFAEYVKAQLGWNAAVAAQRETVEL